MRERLRTDRHAELMGIGITDVRDRLRTDRHGRVDGHWDYKMCERG